MKKGIVGIIGAVVVLVAGFIGYFVYDAHQTAEINKKIQADAKAAIAEPKEELTIQVGTIKETADDMKKKILFPMKEVANQLQKDVGKPFTPTEVYHTLAQGYGVTYMKNHQYIFLNYRDKSSRDYLVVTFNDDETSITKVEYIK